MILKDELDIVLITYNRKEKLTNMLTCIFAEDSPIKECSITFLDNCSTDGTTELLAEYGSKYPNIKHIRHKVNIGGNANIVRAFETVDTSKKYFWILCDDDFLDWTHWDKIQNALNEEKYDIISLYSNIGLPLGENPSQRLASFLIDATFLPSCIYKSKWITSQMLINAAFNIHSMFPQAACFMSIVNSGGNIYRAPFDQMIVSMIKYPDHGPEYVRGMEVDRDPRIADINWQVGFSIALGMLKDQEIKQECVNLLGAFQGQTYEGFLTWYVPYAVNARKWETISTLYTVSNNSQKEKIYELIAAVKMWQDLEVRKASVLASTSGSPVLGIKGAFKYILTGIVLLKKAILIKIKAEEKK